MWQRVSTWAWIGLVSVCLVGLVGCGDPNRCSNDGDCSGGKICVARACVDPPSGNDAGEGTTDKAAEKVPEEKPEPRPEPKPEPRPEPQPEPEPEPEPEKPAPKGERAEGEPCDPRKGAYERDSCAPGLACAELNQTSPSSGAPQPYGICLKACEAGSSTCPSGTVCTETYNTKTRQKTNIFVCAKEVGVGETCVNLQACKQGLSCIRYGTTGTLWLCQKDCTQDVNGCEANQVCEAVASGSAQKVCKDKKNVGDICSAYNKCGDDSLCVGGNRFGAFPSKCLKKCGSPADCDANTESCVRISANGQAVGSVCYKKAKQGEECNRQMHCAEPNNFCLDLTQTYSGCFKRCSIGQDCAKGEICEQYSSRSATKICKSNVPPGGVSVNLAKCAAGARAISFAQGAPGVCLPNCSRGTSVNQAACGKLAAGSFFDAVWGASMLFAFGAYGSTAVSGDDGKTWTRGQAPLRQDIYAVSASGDGKVIVMVGQSGKIGRSEDGGKTWSTVTLSQPVDVSLYGVALSFDGMVAVAVGAKGTILRSEDGGKTWAAITLTPAVTKDLFGVAMGRDTGAGASAPLGLIVGMETVLRSADGGKTWTAVTVADLKGSLRGVTMVRDRVTTGISALAVGDGGQIFASSDNGATWTKGTSNTTEVLQGVALEAGIGLAVGAKGTALRWESGAWTALTAPVKEDFFSVRMKGQSAVIVGRLGNALTSADAGKTWAGYTGTLSRCIGISSNGRPNGGACLFLCDPKNSGKDCPPEMNRCAPLNLQGGPVNICQPGTGTEGTAGLGDPCGLYSGAPANRRCKANHTCIRFGSGAFCAQRCTSDGKIACDGGKTCTPVTSLSGDSFCGEVKDAGEECQLEKGIFCKEGYVCRGNNITGKAKCEPVTVAKEKETCSIGLVRPCTKGTVCIGLGTSPYRRFCARSCVPGRAGDCDSGWQCLGTSGGGGVCLEKCSGNQYKCNVSNLICQQLQAGSFCI